MSEFRALLEKMGQTLKLEESRSLAAAIQSSLFRNSRKTDAAVQDFGVKRAPFFVLLGAEVPAVLAEVSCLSNAEEEAKLASAEHRDDIAAFLETGILDYLKNGEVTYESKK
jgi:N-acetylmuramoyl-L-alanine amidase